MIDPDIQDTVVYGCSKEIGEQISYALLRAHINEHLVEPLWIDVDHLVCNQLMREL